MGPQAHHVRGLARARGTSTRTSLRAHSSPTWMLEGLSKQAYTGVMGLSPGASSGYEVE